MHHHNNGHDNDRTDTVFILTVCFELRDCFYIFKKDQRKRLQVKLLLHKSIKLLCRLCCKISQRNVKRLSLSEATENVCPLDY